MSSRFPAILLLAAAGYFSISCGGIVDPSQNQSETFTGTLTPGGGAKTFPFTASKGGEISGKFTALSPVTSIFLGVIWAQAASDGSCTSGVLQNNQFAQINTTAIAGAIVSGRYCIAVYESSTLSAPETFTFTLSHP